MHVSEEDHAQSGWKTPIHVCGQNSPSKTRDKWRKYVHGRTNCISDLSKIYNKNMEIWINRN